jgi:predicted amidohydrolase
MRVAMVETDTVWHDSGANQARLESVRTDAELIVFPEMAFSGFSMDAPTDEGAEEFLAGLARRNGQAIVAGYVGGANEEGKRTNLAAAFGPDGVRLARYAKLHPFSYAGEDGHYAPGSDLALFDLGGLRIALTICYDLRFPELFREAVLAGAEAFLVIANWPARRADHWRALLRARAIENLAFVVGVNRVGRDPNVEYESSSMAFGPRGELLAEGNTVAELDPGSVRAWRREFPALEDIRTDRYRFGI